MTDIISSIFSWLGDLFGKIWNLFQKVLPYLLVALAIWFSLGLGIPALGIAGGWEASLLALGASFVLAPDETADLLSSGVAAIGDVLTTAGTAVGEAIGATGSALVSSSGLLWIALGVGAYLLLKSDKPALERQEVGSRAGAIPPGRGGSGKRSRSGSEELEALNNG